MSPHFVRESRPNARAVLNSPFDGDRGTTRFSVPRHSSLAPAAHAASSELTTGHCNHLTPLPRGIIACYNIGLLGQLSVPFFALHSAPTASALQLLKSGTLSSRHFECLPALILFVVISRPITST